MTRFSRNVRRGLVLVSAGLGLAAGCLIGDDQFRPTGAKSCTNESGECASDNPCALAQCYMGTCVIVQWMGAGTVVDGGPSVDGGMSNNCVRYKCDGDGGMVDAGLLAMDTPCGNSHSCDGNGQCLWNLGSPCGDAGAGLCASGHCENSVCCREACSECQACDVTGHEGTCTSVSTVPEGGACSDNCQCVTQACSAGACRTQDGQPCQVDADCGSLHCHLGTCTQCSGCTAPSGSPCEPGSSSLPHCSAGSSCSPGWMLCNGGVPCSVNGDCPSGDCWVSPGGPSMNVCLLPMGAYCNPDPNIRACANNMSCKGFPPTCQ
jgi:hypothetical protein